MDRFQMLFLAGSGLLVLVRSIRGWRLGVLRQLVDLVALVLAYAAAILSGRLLTPLLHPLGYPDLLVSVLAGALLGGALYPLLKRGGTALFCGRNENALGLMRLGRGAGGSVLGFASALVTVWLSALAIRCLGTVAQAEVSLASTPQARRTGMLPSPMAIELAGFKQSLDSGPAGAILDGADPVPDRFYLLLNKIAEVISSIDSMQRFVAFPGTRLISQNPRIAALQHDPQIAQQVMHHDFMGLLGNPKIVAAVNDPRVEALVRGFQLEKALDYALAGSSGEGSGPAKN